MPLPGPSVTVKDKWNSTAHLAVAEFSADANGYWNDGGESLEVVYHAGRSPVTIPITSSSTWKSHVIAANHAWDQTREEPGNVMGKPLLGAGVLRLRANETRKVSLQYDRPSLPDHARPALDDELTLTVPMPGGPVPVRFRAAGE